MEMSECKDSNRVELMLIQKYALILLMVHLIQLFTNLAMVIEVLRMENDDQWQLLVLTLCLFWSAFIILPNTVSFIYWRYSAAARKVIGAKMVPTNGCRNDVFGESRIAFLITHILQFGLIWRYTTIVKMCNATSKIKLETNCRNCHNNNVSPVASVSYQFARIKLITCYTAYIPMAIIQAYLLFSSFSVKLHSYSSMYCCVQLSSIGFYCLILIIQSACIAINIVAVECIVLTILRLVSNPNLIAYSSRKQTSIITSPHLSNGRAKIVRSSVKRGEYESVDTIFKIAMFCQNLAHTLVKVSTLAMVFTITLPIFAFSVMILFWITFALLLYLNLCPAIWALPEVTNASATREVRTNGCSNCNCQSISKCMSILCDAFLLLFNWNITRHLDPFNLPNKCKLRAALLYCFAHFILTLVVFVSWTLTQSDTATGDNFGPYKSSLSPSAELLSILFVALLFLLHLCSVPITFKLLMTFHHLRPLKLISSLLPNPGECTDGKEITRKSEFKRDPQRPFDIESRRIDSRLTKIINFGDNTLTLERRQREREIERGERSIDKGNADAASDDKPKSPIKRNVSAQTIPKTIDSVAHSDSERDLIGVSQLPIQINNNGNDNEFWNQKRDIHSKGSLSYIDFKYSNLDYDMLASKFIDDCLYVENPEVTNLFYINTPAIQSARHREIPSQTERQYRCRIKENSISSRSTAAADPKFNSRLKWLFIGETRDSIVRAGCSLNHKLMAKPNESARNCNCNMRCDNSSKCIYYRNNTDECTEVCQKCSYFSNIKLGVWNPAFVSLASGGTQFDTDGNNNDNNNGNNNGNKFEDIRFGDSTRVQRNYNIEKDFEIFI